MKKTRFYSMLMAMAMILSVGIFAACGSDDPDPTPTPTPKPTSCTLYLVEGFAADNFNFANMSRSFVKQGEEESYVAINKEDLTDYNNITPTDLKNKIANTPAVPSAVQENGYFKITPVTITNFPSAFTLKYQFTPQSGVDTNSKYAFGIYRGFAIIDNLGNCSSLTGSGQVLNGIKGDKLSQVLNQLASFYAAQANVVKTDSRIEIQ